MRIVKGQSNRVALTLLEKSVNDDSEYLIKLVNDLSGDSKVFAITDVSDNPIRANIFNIREGSPEDLSNGVVSLETSGQYTYTAYEMNVSSPKNLDPDDAIGIVETGRCLVVDQSEETVHVYSEDDSVNSPTFNEE